MLNKYLPLSSTIINQLENFWNVKIWVVTMLKIFFDGWTLKSFDSQVDYTICLHIFYIKIITHISKYSNL